MQHLFRDTAYALRVFSRRPGLATIILVTLALGVGANTAIFSVVNALVLRRLPYPHPQRLVSIWETNRRTDSDHEQVSPVNLDDFRGLHQVFAGVTGWWRPQVNLTDRFKEPVRVEIVDVTDNFFHVMGVQPILGRGFLQGEDAPGRAGVVVISHALWQERYGGDPGILNQKIDLDGNAHTIVGIAPAGFGFPGQTDIWRPLGWVLKLHGRSAHFMEAVARLEPGVSVEHAQAALSTVTATLAKEYPHSNEGWGARLVPLHDELMGSFRTPLLLLLGAVGVLLLIACANIANLLLIHATSRAREVAVRMALGASRKRVQILFATESTLLALLGGALGLAVAAATLKWVVALAPFALLHTAGIQIDGRVLAFTLAVAVLTGLLVGSAPALRTSRLHLLEALKEASLGHSGAMAAGRARGLLVICEVSLATLLAASAFLLARSFIRLTNEDTGLRGNKVLTANIELPVAKYGDWERVRLFYRTLLDDLRADPLVGYADVTNYLPIEPAWRMPFSIPGRPAARAGEERKAQFRIVGPEYFSAMGIPIRRGRSFGPADDTRAPAAVVVNEEAVRQFWGGGDIVGGKFATPIKTFGPLGQSLMKTKTYEIIGVAADAKNNSLQRKPEPAVYFTYQQFPYRSLYVVVKGRTETANLAKVLRSEVHRLDPGLALAQVRSMDEILSSSVENRKFAMLLMGSFASLAVFLAVMGVYGVLSYAVAQRRHELGIRMALGARHVDILGLVVRQGLALSLAGVLLGIVGARLLAHFIANFLYGITPDDGLTFVGVFAIVVLGGFLASWMPAWRAAHLDPATAMRSE